MGFQLRGKVVLIPGASSGIGAAAARAYSRAGARVVLAARQLARAESLAQELIRLGREAMAVPCDVGDEGQVSEAVSAGALRFGGLDVLVSNAAGDHGNSGYPASRSSPMSRTMGSPTTAW